MNKVNELMAYLDERIQRHEDELVRLDSDYVRSKAHNTPYCLGRAKASTSVHLASLKRIKGMINEIHNCESVQDLDPNHLHSRLSEQNRLPEPADLQTHSTDQ